MSGIVGLRFLERTVKGSLNNIINYFHSSSSVQIRALDLPSDRKLKWYRYNEKIYPPQAPGEERRPGFVCHAQEKIKYSYKKMWYIASMIRGMTIDEALKQLKFVNKKGAVIARNTLLEAQKLAVEEHNIEFKSNLWVSESFVGKSHYLTGFRRHKGGIIRKLKFGYIHYFVTLEEGSPPKYYYHFKRPKTGEEMLNEWIQEMRNRKILGSL